MAEGEDVVASVGGTLPALIDTVSIITSVSVSVAFVAAGSGEGIATFTDGSSAEDGAKEDEDDADEEQDNRGSVFSDAVVGTTRFFLSLAPNVSLSLLAAS